MGACGLWGCGLGRARKVRLLWALRGGAALLASSSACRGASERLALGLRREGGPRAGERGSCGRVETWGFPFFVLSGARTGGRARRSVRCGLVVSGKLTPRSSPGESIFVDCQRGNPRSRRRVSGRARPGRLPGPMSRPAMASWECGIARSPPSPVFSRGCPVPRDGCDSFRGKQRGTQKRGCLRCLVLPKSCRPVRTDLPTLGRFGVPMEWSL